MNISRRISRSQPLATTAMHGRADAMKARGETVIDFSIAISHFPAPEAVLDTVRQALHQTPLPYTAVGGDAGVRARLAHHVAAAHGIPATPADILITNGAKQALYQALYTMTDPGDYRPDAQVVMRSKAKWLDRLPSIPTHDGFQQKPSVHPPAETL